MVAVTMWLVRSVAVVVVVVEVVVVALFSHIARRRSSAALDLDRDMADLRQCRQALAVQVGRQREMGRAHV